MIKQVEETEDNIGAAVLFLSLRLFCKFEIVPKQEVQKCSCSFSILRRSLNLRNLVEDTKPHLCEAPRAHRPSRAGACFNLPIIPKPELDGASTSGLRQGKASGWTKEDTLPSHVRFAKRTNLLSLLTDQPTRIDLKFHCLSKKSRRSTEI